MEASTHLNSKKASEHNSIFSQEESIAFIIFFF